MPRKHEIPVDAMVDAIKDTLPFTRRDMDLQEILEYVENHKQTFREKLADRGHPPEFYEDLPPLAEPSPPDEKSLEALLSTGPLWSTGQDTSDDEIDDKGGPNS